MRKSSQREIFEQQILSHVIQGYRYQSQDLCGFMAMKGASYNWKLMIVGRATNGWGNSITPAEAEDGTARKKFINQIQFPPGQCPMAWVSKLPTESEAYNPRRSAFWRVSKRVSQELGVWSDEQNWSSHLVWSNLYKISPARGGNPSNTLCTIQEPGCIELLFEEIREYSPERVLFLTGCNWAAPFISDHNWIQLKKQKVGTYVEAKGTMSAHNIRKPLKFIVACHPQAKPETDWVHEVLSGFKSLER